MKEVIIIEHENGWKGTWYHSGQIIQVEDFDAPPPHLPNHFQQVGSTNTVNKEHCFVLSEGVAAVKF